MPRTRDEKNSEPCYYAVLSFSINQSIKFNHIFKAAQQQTAAIQGPQIYGWLATIFGLEEFVG